MGVAGGERMRYSVIILGIILLSFAPRAVDAQEGPLADDNWLLSPSLGIAFDADADVSPTLSIGAMFPLTASFGVEGEVGHVFDLASGDADVDSSLTTAHGSLLFFFDSDYELVPYVAAGLGIGRFSHDVENPPASISRTEVGFDLGAGFVRPIAERMWVRVDFRFLKHIDDVPSVWRIAGSVMFRLPD